MRVKLIIRRCFVTVWIILLLVACAPAPAQTPAALLPATSQVVTRTLSPEKSTSTAIPEKGKKPKQGQTVQPSGTAQLQPTRSQGSGGRKTSVPPSQSGSQVNPSLYDLILGRPTDHSVTVSLLAREDMQGLISYGTDPANLGQQLPMLSLKLGETRMVTMEGLSSDTAYTYRLDINGKPGEMHQFHTQRAAGSTFRFTVDADPHNRDPNFNGELYALTLANARADQPDFHINLGDSFMTEKLQVKSRAEAESSFLDLRPYFGLLGADVPLMLVNGNHEGELGWLLRSKDPLQSGLPVWSTQLRQQYYPNPLPDGFYSGTQTNDPVLGAPRDGYYAWTWGDALFVVLDPFWYTTSKPVPDDPNSSWNWTLGKSQYDWLNTTLAGSSARYKFVFIHHLVGGADKDARGGVEAVPFFEWGGQNADGSEGFNQHRPGWGLPIHQILVQNHVSAVFHGHDHVYVRQELDGIIYQEMPQPDIASYQNTGLAKDYGYLSGDVASSAGHLRVTVSPEGVTVEYIRAYLPKDENSSRKNGQVDQSYQIH